MKVLIVDDEPLILNGLVKIVREAAPTGTEVRWAGNVPEALAVMREFMPDVTVTDLNMPEKNGFDLIEEARECGLCDRFTVLTGYDNFEYARKALRFGVVDYLLKPIDKDEIRELLARIDEELPSESDSQYARHVKRILNYMEAHYMQELSLDRVADLMDLHPNYISSLFKKETGDTFVNYLNALRIREAQKLLRTHHHLPVNVIGQRVGFENKHYFTKVFKKYTSITPGAYREDDKTYSSEEGKGKC
ncbi:response regulator [Paenibacillus alkaliterrae]|uniref:response regulator transcription factor n=1 Tax=Paenibacillus alkaliterrae TaxID=320909 RepID=UPI001F456B2C|nr:response regulator [Paenibacillus alkaliterrae]MCF2939455.1 response regulator [Paenibacillus alkaliterrae]